MNHQEKIVKFFKQYFKNPIEQDGILYDYVEIGIEKNFEDAFRFVVNVVLPIERKTRKRMNSFASLGTVPFFLWKCIRNSLFFTTDKSILISISFIMENNSPIVSSDKAIPDETILITFSEISSLVYIFSVLNEEKGSSAGFSLGT